MVKKSVFLILATVILTGIITITINAYNHHHHNNHQTPTTPTTPLDFPSNASLYLRSNGYSFIATLLHISPDLFLSTPESTLFAIPDSAMSNLSIPPYMTVQLITYHILPNKFTLQDLLSKPLNTCFVTMFQGQKVSITRKDEKTGSLDVNNVLVTHPDMFLHEKVAIHGVNGPFASFKFHQEINELPICYKNISDGNSTIASVGSIGSRLDEIKRRGEFKMVVKFLTQSGFAPFAFGLYNVLDGIAKDHPDLHTMTIFAPPVVEVTQMPSNAVNKFMKSHIVPKKHSFKHLASLPEGASIKSLCPGKEVEITSSVGSLENELLSINRVAVTAPDLLVSKSFVVHGIAQAFPMDGVSKVVSL
ncbi:fasciclin-like arabinogalactan protein 21 [Tanacetum coccineum]